MTNTRSSKFFCKTFFFTLLGSLLASQVMSSEIDREAFARSYILRQIDSLPHSLKEACHEDISESLTVLDENASQVSHLTIDPLRPHIALATGSVTLQLIPLLRELPEEVEMIALQLPHGGHAIASVLIAEEIRRMGLSTYSGLTWCHSACTVLFQAGVERKIDPQGLLTYHGVSRHGAGGEDCADAATPVIKNKVVELGFPEALLHSFDNPAIVNPMSANSLLENGIATSVERLLIGRDQEIIEENAKPDYCDRNPDDEEC